MDDVRSAASALNERETGLEFEVSVAGVDEIEDGFVSPRVRDNLIGKKFGVDESLPESKQTMGMCGCLTLAYYRPYFDVDTTDVQERLVRALIPIKKSPSFAELVVAKPDAYGPFWLSTTLVFSIALCSNVASFMDFNGESDEWAYDFTRVASACTLVEILMVGIPVLLWLVGKYLSIPMPLSFLLCAYGYSSAMFIPASFVSTMPIDAFDWVAMLLAMSWSLFFLMSCLSGAFEDNVPREKFLPVLGLVAATHLAWTMVVKLMLF